jgi:transcriptional regulator with XRE-family HTH domain
MFSATGWLTGHAHAPKVAPMKRGRPAKPIRDQRFPNRLREIRTARGMLQDELARRANLSPQHVSDLERGTKQLLPDPARRLAAVLEVAAADITATAGVSVPIRFAIAAAMSEQRPDDFLLPEPYSWVQPSARLGGDQRYEAAEVFDDSADVDFPRHSVLVFRRIADGERLPLGAKVLVRFQAPPLTLDNIAATQEILYGLLDVSLEGDIMLSTRSRNPELPRTMLVQAAARRSGLSERALAMLPREPSVAYSFDGELARGALLGLVVWSSRPE